MQVKIVSSDLDNHVKYSWILPHEFDLWETDPAFYVSRVLTQGSDGSLLKALKDEGLVYHLSVDIDDCNQFRTVSLSMNLTEKGSTDEGIQRITTLLYANIR